MFYEIRISKLGIVMALAQEDLVRDNPIPGSWVQAFARHAAVVWLPVEVKSETDWKGRVNFI